MEKLTEVFAILLEEKLKRKVSASALEKTREKYPNLSIDFLNFGYSLLECSCVAYDGVRVKIANNENIELDFITDYYDRKYQDCFIEEINKIINKIVD